LVDSLCNRWQIPAKNVMNAQVNHDASLFKKKSSGVQQAASSCLFRRDGQLFVFARKSEVRRFAVPTSIFKKVLCVVFPLVGALYSMAAGCASTSPTEQDDEHVGVADQALTPEQCNYFAVEGKVQICHRTASSTKPFTILKISEAACVSAHTLHAGDYVAVDDPNCQGGGCLPENAPCDPTVPCCDGFSCTEGTCTPNVSDHCDPSPCQNGGSCTNDAAGYTCACPAGYTGTNCENEIDECQSNPCVNGQCMDAINAYACECAPGWTGTNCDTAEASSCPCDANPSWQNAMAGTLVTTGPCLSYTFPGPCGSLPDHSWAFSLNGSTLTRIIAGEQESMMGTDRFCGVQVHAPSTCGGQGIDGLFTVTAEEAAACRAKVLNFAAVQGGVCN
jgi:hypothetical protein